MLRNYRKQSAGCSSDRWRHRFHSGSEFRCFSGAFFLFLWINLRGICIKTRDSTRTVWKSSWILTRFDEVVEFWLASLPLVEFQLTVPSIWAEHRDTRKQAVSYSYALYIFGNKYFSTGQWVCIFYHWWKILFHQLTVKDANIKQYKMVLLISTGSQLKMLWLLFQQSVRVWILPLVENTIPLTDGNTPQWRPQSAWLVARWIELMIKSNKAPRSNPMWRQTKNQWNINFHIQRDSQ